MKTEQRILDILKTDLFNQNEISVLQSPHLFKSWEYYNIYHYTNEEYYYLDSETVNVINESCDNIAYTDKGIIFMYM